MLREAIIGHKSAEIITKKIVVFSPGFHQFVGDTPGDEAFRIRFR